jgi:hypothetical protein
MNFVIEGIDSNSGKDRRIEVQSDDERSALFEAKARGIFPYRIEAIEPGLKKRPPPVAPRFQPSDAVSGKPHATPVLSTNEELVQAMNRVNAANRRSLGSVAKNRTRNNFRSWHHSRLIQDAV